ncbi:YHS domain-containing (seleno)protein [Pyruvatibacter sp.]|uniref:YHS domain-containing (seleno)protein n=1 Tax=Pyruvatibacter sp. TaxID=1981328 RepID=UPI0032EDE8B6
MSSIATPIAPYQSAWHRLFVVVSALLLAAAFFVSPAHAAKDVIYTGFFSDLAVSGYDPVAYFTDGKPVEGSAAFETTHEGATWRFASKANLDAFVANPEAYAPQYGGYCAWAVSQGYTASADPENWSVVDGKLYLNFDDSVQATWETDIPGFIKKADANWPAVLK